MKIGKSEYVSRMNPSKWRSRLKWLSCNQRKSVKLV